MSIKRQVAILEQQLQDTLKGIEDLKIIMEKDLVLKH